MAKCLRCGAGAEWIQGRVPDEVVEGDSEKDARIASLAAEVERLQAGINAFKDLALTGKFCDHTDHCINYCDHEQIIAELTRLTNEAHNA